MRMKLVLPLICFVSTNLAAEVIYLECQVSYTYRQYNGFSESGSSNLVLEISRNGDRTTLTFNSSVPRLNGFVVAGLSEQEKARLSNIEIIDQSTSSKWHIQNRFKTSGSHMDNSIIVNRRLGRIDIRMDTESLDNRKWDSVTSAGSCQGSGEKNRF